MSTTFDGAVTYHLGLAAGDARLADCLTPDERVALARIDRPSRRADWLAGVAAAKRAAGLATGETRLDHIEIRPRLADGATAVITEDDGTLRPSGVSLAVARRGGRAAAVAVRGAVRAGVHLERDDAVRAEHVPHLLTEAERSALAHYDAAAVWALKAAAWKALAGDDAMVLGAVELAFDARGAVRACVVCGERVAVRATVWRPWPGWALAIVVETDAAGPTR